VEVAAESIVKVEAAESTATGAAAESAAAAEMKATPDAWAGGVSRQHRS